MSTIIAGHFEHMEDLHEAVELLHERGFSAEDYATYYLNPPGAHGLYRVGIDARQEESAPGAGTGAATGAAAGGAAGAALGIIGGPIAALAGGGIGAYVGSLIGALGQMDRLERENADVEERAEHSGPLIAVNANDSSEEQTAVNALMRCSPLQIDRASGDWQHGEWVDFDEREPLETLHRSDPGQN